MPAQVHLTEMPTFDLIIFGGRVIDPANSIDDELDVGVSGGVISAVARDLPKSRAKQIYDAAGKLVVPGLIDTHVHVFDGVAPYGMDADEYCLSRGSTTVLDCGDAGCNSLDGLKMYVARRTQCRVLALCHAAATGLVSPDPMGMDPNMGELTDINVVNVPKTVHAIKSDLASSDPFCVGVKIRLARAVSNNGANEREGFKRALQMAEETGTVLMVHHNGSSLTVTEVLGQMRPGDIYTHCFHPGNGEGTDTALADTDTLSEVVKEARDRGVLFDLGHGQGSFSWNCAEAAARAGFWPDSLSTDLHVASINGPAYDMPTCMTKYLMLGMPLDEVVAGATSRAAEMLGQGWADHIGTLGVGRGADITILELEDVDVMLEDCLGQLRPCRERLVCRAVWRDGVPGRITEEPVWPNPESQAWQQQGWENRAPGTRDEIPPPPPDPSVMARVNARQDHLRYLAGAAARMGGDCNPNMPAYLSPAAVGHLSRWFTLPWCADSEKVEAATKLATVQQDESANHSSSPETPDPATTNITGCRGDSRLGKPLLALKSISSLRDTAGLPMKLAQRQLLAFPATPEEIEATRLAVLYGCC